MFSCQTALKESSESECSLLSLSRSCSSSAGCFSVIVLSRSYQTACGLLSLCRWCSSPAGCFPVRLLSRNHPNLNAVFYLCLHRVSELGVCVFLSKCSQGVIGIWMHAVHYLCLYCVAHQPDVFLSECSRSLKESSFIFSSRWCSSSAGCFPVRLLSRNHENLKCSLIFLSRWCSSSAGCFPVRLLSRNHQNACSLLSLSRSCILPGTPAPCASLAPSPCSSMRPARWITPTAPLWNSLTALFITRPWPTERSGGVLNR